MDHRGQCHFQEKTAELQDVFLSSVLKVCKSGGRSSCEVDGVRFPTNSASSEIFKEEQKDCHSLGLYHPN